MFVKAAKYYQIIYMYIIPPVHSPAALFKQSTHSKTNCDVNYLFIYKIDKEVGAMNFAY